MSQIDWSKAPEGTTGAMVANFTSERNFPGRIEWIPSDEPARDVYTEGPDAWTYYEAPKPWNGEGLPPVGTVCEMHIDGHGWERGTVACHIQLDEPVAVAHNGVEVFHGSFDDFRPIRTPDQIAAEDREKAVCDMVRIVIPGALYDTSPLKTFAGVLYDAGFRKLEIVEGE